MEGVELASLPCRQLRRRIESLPVSTGYHQVATGPVSLQWRIPDLRSILLNSSSLLQIPEQLFSTWQSWPVSPLVSFQLDKQDLPVPKMEAVMLGVSRVFRVKS